MKSLFFVFMILIFSYMPSAFADYNKNWVGTGSGIIFEEDYKCSNLDIRVLESEDFVRFGGAYFLCKRLSDGNTTDITILGRRSVKITKEGEKLKYEGEVVGEITQDRLHFQTCDTENNTGTMIELERINTEYWQIQFSWGECDQPWFDVVGKVVPREF